MSKHETTPTFSQAVIEANAGKLTKEHHAILLLATAGGYRSIADSLQVPLGTVRSRLHRARAALTGIIATTKSDGAQT